MLSEVETEVKFRNNKGLSLVELVVTMAILAIVSVAVVGFLLVCLRQYEKGSSEVNLQYESQLAINQIQDMVIDAANGVGYESGKLFVYNYDTQTGTEEKIELKQEDDRLLYTRYTLDGNQVWVADAASKNQPFADYIDSFSAELYGKDGQEVQQEEEAKEVEQVKIHLKFAWKKQTFSSEHIITLRNTVVASTNIEKIFSNLTPGSTPKVQDVVISPSSIYAWEGSDAGSPFSATVVGNNLTDTSVRWELEDTNAAGAGTKITEDGRLTVGEGQTENFKVRAVSVLSEQLGTLRYGTANVMVKSLRGLYINACYRNEDTMSATAVISIAGKNLEGSSKEMTDISDRLLFAFWCDGQEVTDISIQRQQAEAASTERYTYRYLVTVPEEYIGKTIILRVGFAGNSNLLAQEEISFPEIAEQEVTSLRLYRVGSQGLQDKEIQTYPGGSFTLRAVASYSDETSANVAYSDSGLSFHITEGQEYVAEDRLKTDGTIIMKQVEQTDQAVVTVEAQYKGYSDKITLRFRDAGITINEKNPNQKKEFITVGKDYAVPLTFTVSGISNYRIECKDSGGMKVSVEGERAVIYAENKGDYKVIFTLVDADNGCDTGKTAVLEVHAGESNLKYKKWSLWKRKYISHMLEPSWYVPEFAEWQEYTDGTELTSMGNAEVSVKTIRRSSSLLGDDNIVIDNEKYAWEDEYWVTDRTFD